MQKKNSKKLILTWHLAFALCLLSHVEHVNCQEKAVQENSLRRTTKTLKTITPDLVVPILEESKPASGKRVKVNITRFAKTDVYHTLYLPVDWRADRSRKYPIIVEYAGNGPYRSPQGDHCTGKVDDCKLGYGISGGKEFIWVCLPYISKDGTQNQLQWWGDLDATVDYCKQVVPKICEQWNGDADSVFIAGFSRGAIACNYIGLFDDEIAKLWHGFICHSHYDGARSWSYPGSDRKSAMERLKRLNKRPQFISHERSIEATKQYLASTKVEGRFTFHAMEFPNHTDTWALRDVPIRRAARRWITKTLEASK